MRSVLGTARYWLPVAVAFALLIGVSYVSPIVGYLFIVAAAALVFEVGTALLAGANRTGGMPDHRQ